MVYKLEVTSVAGALGVIFPEAIVQRLCIKPGDILSAIDTPTGVELTTNDPEFAEQLEIAKRVMQEDRNLLRKLADS